MRECKKDAIFLTTLCILFVAFMALVGYAKTSAETKPLTAEMQIWFSPNGGCTDAIVNAISQAKSEVLVQAYSFTSAPIAKALLEAHKRGVHVEVILDKSQETQKYSSATFLDNTGMSPLIDDAHAIAHNKIIIIDKKTVVTGSFNFSKAAEEKNAENLLIIQSPQLAALYIQNFNDHKAHARPYENRRK